MIETLPVSFYQYNHFDRLKYYNNFECFQEKAPMSLVLVIEMSTADHRKMTILSNANVRDRFHPNDANQFQRGICIIISFTHTICNCFPDLMCISLFLHIYCFYRLFRYRSPIRKKDRHRERDDDRRSSKLPREVEHRPRHKSKDRRRY